MTRPKRIGLTGNIGSGKSTVAQLLVARGAVLIDADVLARDAVQDPEVLAAIGAALGPDLIEGGRLDRARTAARVFGDAAALNTLNGIIHPWVRRASEARFAALAAQDPPPEVVLFDIPLLYENGLEQDLDAVIVVTAPTELRQQRVAARSGQSADEFAARDSKQWPLADKVRRADYVVVNGGTLAALEARCAALWAQLSAAE